MASRALLVRQLLHHWVGHIPKIIHTSLARDDSPTLVPPQDYSLHVHVCGRGQGEVYIHAYIHLTYVDIVIAAYL